MQKDIDDKLKRNVSIKAINICGNHEFLFNHIIHNMLTTSSEQNKLFNNTLIIFSSTQYMLTFKKFLYSNNICHILPRLYSIHTLIEEYHNISIRNYYDSNIITAKIFTKFKGIFYNDISYTHKILDNIKSKELTEEEKSILSHKKLNEYIKKYYRYTHTKLIKDATLHNILHNIGSIYIVGFSYKNNSEKIIMNTISNLFDINNKTTSTNDKSLDIDTNNSEKHIKIKYFFFNLFEEQKLEIEKKLASDNTYNIDIPILDIKSEISSLFDIKTNGIDIKKILGSKLNNNNTETKNHISKLLKEKCLLYEMPRSNIELSKYIADIVLQSYNSKEENRVVIITSDDKLKLFLSKYLFGLGWSLVTDIPVSSICSAKFALKVIECLIFGFTRRTIGAILNDNYVKTKICQNNETFLYEKNIINKYLYQGHDFFYCFSQLSNGDNNLKSLFNNIQNLIARIDVSSNNISGTIKAYHRLLKKYLDHDDNVFNIITNIEKLKILIDITNIKEYKDILNFIFNTSKTKRERVYKKTIRIYSPKTIGDIINVDKVIITSPDHNNFNFTNDINKKYCLYSLLNNNNTFHIFCNQETKYSEFMLLISYYIKQQDFEYQYLPYYLEEHNNNNQYSDIRTANPSIEDRPKKISCTALKQLIQCPYQFYLDYILQLDNKDYTKYFSIDKKLIGTLIHNILERVGENTINQPNMNVYTKEIDNIVCQCIYTAISDKKEWFTYIYTKTKKIINEVFRKIPFHTSTILERKFSSNILGISVYAKLDRVDMIKAIDIAGNNNVNILIYDYKTGSIPTISDIISGYEPQLLLQALLYCKNSDTQPHNITELSYIKINFEHATVEKTDILKNKDIDIAEILYNFEKNIEKVLDFYLLSQNEFKVDLRYI